MISPAHAYWNQRQALSQCRERIKLLMGCVDRSSDLRVFQWAQLISMALEFAPTLILELGRLNGNSTCAFTEAANQLGNCRVLSLCNSRAWDEETSPRLKKALPAEWFKPLKAERADIITFDYAKALAGAERVFLFWDAHGFEIAECVLGKILPMIAERPHLVIMHDMSDARYCGEDQYNGKGLWKGSNTGDPRMRLGHIDSGVAQAVSIVDFTTRNKLSFDSADHSYRTELPQDQIDEMEKVLQEMFSLEAHWFWFTLNQHDGPHTFPKFDPLPGNWSVEKDLVKSIFKRAAFRWRSVSSAEHQ